MTEQTQGIVLRVIRYSESSLIVHWLTQDAGRIATMAKGALRPKSEFRGKLDLFHHCQLTYQRSHRSTLHTLREVSLTKVFERLSRDMDKVNQATYVAQLISKSTEEDTPADGMFELMGHFLEPLNKVKETDLLHVLNFEFILLRILGLEPQWKNDRLSAEAKQTFKVWSEEGANDIDFTSDHLSKVRLEIFKYLGRFMTYHLGLPPKLRADLLE
jgi:DNA repair protein RecO (recombination protein O)